LRIRRRFSTISTRHAATKSLAARRSSAENIRPRFTPVKNCHQQDIAAKPVPQNQTCRGDAGATRTRGKSTRTRCRDGNISAGTSGSAGCECVAVIAQPAPGCAARLRLAGNPPPTGYRCRRPSVVPILTTSPNFLQRAAPVSAPEAICTSPVRWSPRSRLVRNALVAADDRASAR
jgi:hypothetical protein